MLATLQEPDNPSRSTADLVVGGGRNEAERADVAPLPAGGVVSGGGDFAFRVDLFKDAAGLVVGVGRRIAERIDGVALPTVGVVDRGRHFARRIDHFDRAP